MDEPGKVANPARGQLKREIDISLSSLVPDNLVSRDRFFVCPVPRHLVTTYNRVWMNRVRFPILLVVS